MFFKSQEAKDNYTSTLPSREMLRGVDTKTVIIQCVEKISMDKIPFEEMRCLWLSKERKKSNQAGLLFYFPLDQQSKLSPKITTLEHCNLFGAHNYSSRVQVPTYYYYFAFSKIHQVRSRGLALKPDRTNSRSISNNGISLNSEREKKKISR